MSFIRVIISCISFPLAFNSLIYKAEKSTQTGVVTLLVSYQCNII